MKTKLAVICIALLGLSCPVVAEEVSGASGEGPATRISTRVFVNLSDREHQHRDGPDEGLGVDLKRLYLIVDHRFSEKWSAQLLTDVQWHRQKDPTDIWLRHAYLERKFDNGMRLQIGNYPTPWIAEEAREGFRYIDPQLVAMHRLGEAADYGIHVNGRRGAISYAAAVVTGGGFQRPRLGNGPDLEARIGWFPHPSLELAAGAYQGTRALDAGRAKRQHTARRWNLMASWVSKRGRAGVQYFYADNWNQVVKPVEDARNGWSTWASYSFAPRWSVFARHDQSRLSRRLNPGLEEHYSHIGLEWKYPPHLRLALLGKRHTRDAPDRQRRTDEVGLWTMFSY